MSKGIVVVSLRRLGVKAGAFGATDLLIGTSLDLEYVVDPYMPRI